MQPAPHAILLSAFLALAGSAVAGPFEDGEAAFTRRDYSTAFQLLRPLAEQRNAPAQRMIGIYTNTRVRMLRPRMVSQIGRTE